MSNQEDKTILILGDWFIDENWLVAKQHMASSSHTGDMHFISRHEGYDKRMISLCGASEILEVIRCYFQREDSKNHYDLLAYGVWNKHDHDVIKCTLCSRHTEKKYLTPFTLSSLQKPIIKNDKRYCPYESTDDIECIYTPVDIRNLAANNKPTTNRIIRCYESKVNGQPHLMFRFDWQRKIEVGDINLSEFDILKKEIKDKKKNVVAVIIEDHGKGVVSEDTIEKLLDTLLVNESKISWYIRSKSANPNWMQKLRNSNISIRLRVTDYKLALNKKGERRWWYGKNVGRFSLEMLGALTNASIYKHGVKHVGGKGLNTERAAIMLDDNTAIAKDQDQCYNLYECAGPKQIINIGRTTMFYNALIAQDLTQDLQAVNFGVQCRKALEIAYAWSVQASEEWNQKNLYFYGNYCTALDLLNKQSGQAGKDLDNSYSYNKLWSDWNQSSAEMGIIVDPISKSEKLEIWRGEGILEKYICVGGPKRDAINNLVSKIGEYVSEKEHSYPFNSLIVGSPGWGKSFLAKCIAAHFNIPYLEFSLSQMATTRDLIDCYDSICSYQNRKQKKVLIFMDEINCKIEGHSAMGLLLNPIWDGLFVRDGKTYKLAPAVWLFASTDSISDIATNNNKGSDFVSRLNGPAIDLDALSTGGSAHISTLNNLKKALVANSDYDPDMSADYKLLQNIKGQSRTEQVYICVKLLNELWGPITLIEKHVLKLFYELLPINGSRSMEFFISQFRNIQNGIVGRINIPKYDDFDEMKRHIVLPSIWRKEIDRDEDLINWCVDGSNLVQIVAAQD